MSIFDKKTEKEALKKGGRLEKEGSYSPEEIEMAMRLVRELCEGKADGFFVVIHASPEGDHQTRAEGMMKVKNFGKDRVLDVVMKSIGMDKDAIQQYALLKSLGD